MKTTMRMTAAAVLSGLWLLCATTATAQPVATVIQHVRLPAAQVDHQQELANVVAAINAGDLDTANGELLDIFKTDNKNPVLFCLHGITMYARGKYDLAKSDEDAAITLDPNVADFYYYRGLAIAHNPGTWVDSDFRAASADFSKAIALDPTLGDAFRERAYLTYYRGIKDPDTQSYWYDLMDAIRLNPDDAEAHYLNGVVHIWLEEWPAIVDDLTTANRLGINRSGLFENRGYAYFKMDKRQEALADYQKALELDPANAVASGNIALLQSGKRKVDLALGDPKGSDGYAKQMNDLFNAYSSEAGSAASWTHVDGADQQEICHNAMAWWTAVHNGDNYLAQMLAIARSDDEKQTLTEQMAKDQAAADLADATMKNNNCSF